MVGAAFLFVISDQVNKSSAVYRYAWGEAFRAVLLQKEIPGNAAVMFIESTKAGGPDEEYPAFVTNDDKAGTRVPIAETLAHWLAGDSPTMGAGDAGSITADRVSFEIPVPALQDTLEITIQKKGAADLHQYGDSSAIDFSAFSSPHEGPRSTWPGYARAAFVKKCAGKESRLVPGFKTEQYWFRPDQSPKGVNSGIVSLRHAVQMHDFDYIISLRIRGSGFLPAMTLHTTYSLRYIPDLEIEAFVNRDGAKDAAGLVLCTQFVPEMGWINGSDYVWREYDRLAPEGPILNYFSEDYSSRPAALEKLVEQARAGVSSIPMVSESLPASLVLGLAPWISIILAIVSSRRIRVLEQSFPGGARDAFFGRSLGPSPKLSWLDGRVFRAIERSVRGSIAIAAALAPSVIALTLPAATSGILIMSNLSPLPAPELLLPLAVLVMKEIASDTVVAVQVAVALLCSVHLLGTIWRSATRPTF